MNIGIEATRIHLQDGGFGVYPRKLISNILQIDTSNKYIIFLSERVEELNRFSNCHQLIVPSSEGTINFLKVYFNFRHWICEYDIDILHLLGLYGIYKSPKLTISTVHDLRHLAVPELKERRLGKIIYKYWLPYLLKDSCHFIAVSEKTKIDMGKYLNIQKEKITTIHQGHEVKFYTERKIELAELPEKYFLWVGMITKRKNIETLYKSFEKFLNYHSNYKLVIVGKFLNSTIENGHKKLLYDLNIKNSVIFTGYISDVELHGMYKKSVAFVFPSIYEGFGIPIIEAMALGAPVITTIDGGATKEVAGDAALFFHKYDANELAKKMDQIVSDKELRELLIKKGKERAATFTWEKTAELTLGVYNKVKKIY